MGKYFSDVVEKAIEDIYYCYDPARAAAAIEPLAAASNAGDGDAAYILSRCLSGPQYSWKYHPFPEDDEGVERLIRRSIQLGSAAGVLGAMRAGVLTPELEASMPFASLQEAWNVIYEKAEAGSPFCQNMIGNTYFWLDIPAIEGKGPDSFPSREAFAEYLRESTLKCIPWFEKAFRGGMGFAGGNLFKIYNEGDGNWLPPQPEKAEEVARWGAERGYPNWLEQYGALLLKKEGREKEGLEFCEQAAEKGQLSAWYHVGNAYREGKGVDKDVPHALACFEKGLADPHAVGCANWAGYLYYEGRDGVPQDRARAVQLFERAYAEGNTWGNAQLAACYLFGWGCQKDEAKAVKLLREVNYSTNLLNYCWGMIYSEGLGGEAEDIKKGVEYLQKAGNFTPAKEALLKFKKNLFGKWVRR